MKKRLLSALLALVMVCTLLPVTVWAGEVTTGPCGAQGDNVGYKLSSDGYLYIGGSGAMADYDHTNPVREAPWADEYVTSIGINSGVTRIGADSFTFCLTGRVSIPTTVTSIGNGAFNYCMRLKSLAIPNSVTELGEATFANCTQLVNLAIGAGVTRITPQLFMNCRSLENVTLPARVTSIGEQAFASCEDLKYIVITGTNLRSIGANAFKNCISLTDIYFKGSQAQWNRIAIDSSNVALKRAVIHYNYDGTTAPTLATPVMTLSRDTSADKPRISWNSVDGAAQYEIYRSTDNVNFSIIRRTTGLSYTDTTAAAGTTYYYKVRAINGADISLFCAAQSIKSPAVPSAPTMTLTTDRSGKPVLNWTSVKDASAYEVYRSTTGAAGSYKIVRRTSGLTWTDTSTEMDKTYYYVVRAKNGNLCGKFCAAKSVKCPIILSAPTMTLDLDRSANKPVISWPAVPFAAQYEIYRSTTGANKSYRIIRRTSGLTYTDTTAASGTTYYYTVRAMRSTASGTIYSSFCKVQSTLPAVPTMTLQVNSTTGLPVISWKKAANATQYEVYRSDTGAAGSFRIIRRTIGLSYTDTTAEAGHTYYYVVRGMQGTSPHIFYGKFCPAQSIQCTAVPDVPAMTLTNDSDTGKPVISWSKAANAAQYEVFRSTDGSSFSIVRRTIGLTWTDPNTESGVIYYYKVRAINGSVKGAFCEAQSILFTAQDIIANGSCGDNVTWKLLGSGTMLIIGRGPMWDYAPPNDSFGSHTPWATAGLLSDIKEVVIRPGVTSIGDSAFFGCSRLTCITIPDSVIEIGSDAFAYCSRLTNITIPDSITTINIGTFSFCSNLTSIAIPSSVTLIGNDAFYKCSNLKKVYYGGSKKDWSSVSISPYNAPLWSATILYNQTEPWR